MWKPKELWYLLRTKGKARGVTGFAGQCAQLAFCTKEYLYPQAEVVGAFNKSLYDKGILYGHVFLYMNGVYFDAARASKRIGPFLPLVRISYDDFKVNPFDSKPSRTIKQKGDSLVIVRHLVRSDVEDLEHAYPFVCDIFR